MISVHEQIEELWDKIEPLIKYDEYGEYLQSLYTVSKYGNSTESPLLYESILKELKDAYIELYEAIPEEVPTFLNIRIKLGDKKRGFSKDDAKAFIKSGTFFPGNVVDYWVVQDY